MNKKQIALDAINEVFGNTSVSPETTLERLEELREEIDGKIELIESDLARKEEFK